MPWDDYFAPFHARVPLSDERLRNEDQIRNRTDPGDPWGLFLAADGLFNPASMLPAAALQ